VSTWRVAKSLDKLLAQINALAPGRSKASDGAIGDSAHASRDSDHNPWYVALGTRWVTARDFTHDSRKFDAHSFAETLRISRDKRIKYVISNRRIFSGPGSVHEAWQWRSYAGSNPHDKHIHVSVRASGSAVLSTSDWATHRPTRAVKKPRKWVAYLRNGSTGGLVKLVQLKLHIKVDGIFGIHTEAAVRAYQKSRRLKIDGVVGPITAKSLGL
jgi:peptidoglycan hydrolase-like protein with peptidoglycan-binding domain